MKVIAIYASLETRSSLFGTPCVIVELGEENAEEGLDVGGIVSKLSSFGQTRVVITGKAPLEEEEISDLIDRLLEAHYDVVLHTTGSRDLNLIDQRIKRVLIITGPSLVNEGPAPKLLWGNLNRLKKDDEIHFIVGDREDYAWAREVIENHDLLGNVAIHFSTYPGRLCASVLGRWIVEDGLDYRLLPDMSFYTGKQPVPCEME